MRRLIGLLLVTVLLATGACSSAAKPGPVAINVTIANGKVTPSGAKFDVVVGSEVTITITSDAADQVHVHGYEIEKDVVAGTPTVITFTADKTGSYEVETHVVEATIATLHVR